MLDHYLIQEFKIEKVCCYQLHIHFFKRGFKMIELILKKINKLCDYDF